MKINGSNINIVGDDALLDTIYQTNAAIRKILQENYNDLYKKKNIRNKIEADIKLYPNIPQFKNQLEVYYSLNNEFEKSAEVNKWARLEHPNYLYSILNATRLLLEQKQFEEVKKLLGGKFLLITDLYPERDTFHTSEFISYNQTVAKYFLYTNEFKQAQIRLDIVKKLGEQDEDFLWIQEQLKIVEAYHLQIPNTNYFDIPKTIRNFEKSFFPVYKLKEIEHIIKKNAIEITQDDLNIIYKLDRNTVIADLELAIDDVINNEYYYLNQVEFQNLDQIIIACFLLRELKSNKSLKKIIQFLVLEKETIETWMDDFTNEYNWMLFYDMYEGNKDLIFQFIQNDNVYAFDKCAATDALVELSKIDPKIKEETLHLFKTILQNSIDQKENNTENEILFNSLVVGNILDLNGIELIDIIEDIYVNELVEETINGDFENVLKEINNPLKIALKKLNTLEIFENCDFEDDLEYPTQKPIVSTKPNIGRNDTCVCGSGKKYKKCCFDLFN